jgi:hypothetical protein
VDVSRLEHHRFTQVPQHRSSDQWPDRRVADERRHPIVLRRERDAADQQMPKELPGLRDLPTP